METIAMFLEIAEEFAPPRRRWAAAMGGRATRLVRLPITRGAANEIHDLREVPNGNALRVW